MFNFLKELDVYYNFNQIFSINKIFTRHDFDRNIKNVDELNNILDDPDASTLIFQRYNELYKFNSNDSNDNNTDDGEIMDILMDNNKQQKIDEDIDDDSDIISDDNNKNDDTIVSIEQDINAKNGDSIDDLIGTDDDMLI